MTRERTVELTTVIQRGEPQGDVDRAWKELRAANLGLVWKTVQKFLASGVPREDLIQEGELGLLAAARKFDPARGTQFSTVAQSWILQHVSRACPRQKPLHRGVEVPTYLLQGISCRGHVPNPKYVEAAQGLGSMVFSLDEVPVSHFGFSDVQQESWAALIPGPDDTEREVLQRLDEERVLALLELLEPLDREVLECRFGLNGRRQQTMREISQRTGRSREGIRLREVRALGALRRLAHLLRWKLDED